MAFQTEDAIERLRAKPAYGMTDATRAKLEASVAIKEKFLARLRAEIAEARP